MEKYPVNNSYNEPDLETPRSTDDTGSQANNNLDATADLSLAANEQPTNDLSDNTKQRNSADQPEVINNQTLTSPGADKEDTAEPTIDDNQQDKLGPDVPYARSSYFSEQTDEPSTERRRHTTRNIAIGTVAVIALVGTITLFTASKASASSTPSVAPTSSQPSTTADDRAEQTDATVTPIAPADTNETQQSETKTDSEKEASAMSEIEKLDKKLREKRDKNDHGNPLTTQKIADELKYSNIKEAVKANPYMVGKYLCTWMKDNGYGLMSYKDYDVIDFDGGKTAEVGSTYHLGGYNEEGKYVSHFDINNPDDNPDEGSGTAFVDISPKTGKFCVRVSLSSGPHTKKDAKGNSIIKKFTYSDDELMSAKNLSEYALKKFTSEE